MKTNKIQNNFKVHILDDFNVSLKIEASNYHLGTFETIISNPDLMPEKRGKNIIEIKVDLTRKELTALYNDKFHIISLTEENKKCTN